jgi:hypothetical protein
LIEGAGGILVDNVNGKLDSETLASYATADGKWSDRVLGVSKTVSFEPDRLIALSMNNPAISFELIRRTLSIRLVAPTARP